VEGVEGVLGGQHGSRASCIPSSSQSSSPLHRFHTTERHSRDFIQNLYKRITSLIASDLPVPTLG